MEEDFELCQSCGGVIDPETGDCSAECPVSPVNLGRLKREAIMETPVERFNPWLVGVVMYFRPEEDAAGEQTGKFEMQMDVPRIAEMPLALLKSLAGLLAGTVQQIEAQAGDMAAQKKTRLIV